MRAGPWTAAFVDRASTDCLQMFLATSAELQDPSPADAEAVTTQLLALFAYVHEHDPPGADTANARFWGARTEKREAGDVVFAGCVHSATAALIRTHPLVVGSGLRVAKDELLGPGGPYRKLVWRAGGSGGDDGLPDGLEWDRVRTDADMDAVMASNKLVRVRSQLDDRPNVAVRDPRFGNLVGWVYFGLDGSVKTLFVVPEWRGRGLAKAMIGRLTRVGMGTGDGDRVNCGQWSHTDVAPDNAESTGLFERGFGAKSVQESYWMRVDCECAAKVLKMVEER